MNNTVNSRNSLSSQSLQAAAQAAAQINAQLAAEGKIQPQPQQNLQANNGAQKKDKKLKTGRKDLFNAEVEINNLPPRVRNLLTKGYIQEQIQWKSKAALCTKGRYVSQREKLTANDERPLYICIQAVDKHAVDEAIHHIQDFIAEHTGSSPTPPVISPTLVPNHPPPQVTLIRDKVYINLDHAPETFKIVERVLGPSGDNVNYIQTETGVSVSLQGQGISSSNASDEPHHLLLEHIEPSAVQNARSLALSLVGTLQQDFIQWQREQQALQQQQLVYTFSQPYYSGSSTASGNFTYPAVAMVYGMENGLTQTAAVREPQSLQTHQHTRGLPGKRPSRFDYQQSTGVFPVRETARTSFHPHRMTADFLDIQRT
ncbi:KH homology domain-containing protein 4-like isoform X1 [Daphnia pulex]|uniref:KH homology domain-containing protein 4-like isoform X1 n=1 Tax=Daphnia pulex TaxID=6669 RepID=UPI001EDFF7A0|nr:KH homology domain-containing protein 4-like isoform X1 [Daphnia pulex]